MDSRLCNNKTEILLDESELRSEAYFLVFARTLVFFLPSISSASSQVSGGHCPAACNSFRWSISLMLIIVLHFGYIKQLRNLPFFTKFLGELLARCGKVVR